ncbi:CPBP family intramembrane metalloprotease [Bacillaceae bacterium SIJ1]|uniref:CPBP family intramembrane glutamic endopeptidase n=1 Tax=Litoribacterium kuwaitense TaxID=1398745 RepID=UPI0013EA08AA|nr:CPBP family intramembrane glutamic endopeptidase [Litoribacterium kuwaitense]NGP43678.1 CPBP family intramembrane metalloprotease [Litoribacterium kuwaitense]
MSHRLLLINAYLSQVILLVVAVLLLWLLPLQRRDIAIFFHWPSFAELAVGIGGALIVLCIEWVLSKTMSKDLLDDGGINQALFAPLSYHHMIFLCLVVSFVEEALFRVVLQTQFGLILAALLFAFVHFRYVKRPFLLVFVTLVSFWMGFLFQVTASFWTVVIAHTIINLAAGLQLKKRENELHDKSTGGDCDANKS